ncbi:AI-2E family transporter [Halapricum hydrolyticum]|uniref:AI-2E family transporter n=1 Tax=Halapricum hydrolyticum TaxID=2979991 RepID=A0AAE3LIU0_9EURY|nr:AI-2E family transporter [Halapricum hydrolyticum]MCU4717499.1 AI-2E family transporter [Halapricum hydrolyticum]MCU4726663.1 AI-2E family transporter [Halapricum hydrolyticum]
MVRRVTVLAGLLVVLGALSMVILGAVFGTIFFAITVAYVLYPVREQLIERGLGRRTAAAASTALAFVAVALIVLPVVIVLYVRRNDLITLLEKIPDEVVLEVAGMRYPITLSDLSAEAAEVGESLALSVAGSTPALGFKLFLFVLLVYALLVRPEDVTNALLHPIPREYHDVVMALHERLRSTLYAIYVLQAATSVGTFLVAFVLFWALGYETAFSLAVVSGILQFVPIIGPSVLVLAIAGFEVALGNTTGAIVVAVLGLFLIGFLPDALIRPQLAALTAKMPGSLYFIGFVGGILSIGVVGVIAGPVVVGLIAEVGLLLADERHPRLSDYRGG